MRLFRQKRLSSVESVPRCLRRNKAAVEEWRFGINPKCIVSGRSIWREMVYEIRNLAKIARMTGNNTTPNNTKPAADRRQRKPIQMRSAIITTALAPASRAGTTQRAIPTWVGMARCAVPVAERSVRRRNSSNSPRPQCAGKMRRRAFVPAALPGTQAQTQPASFLQQSAQ